MSLDKKPQNINAFPSTKTEYDDIGGMDISRKVHFQGMTLRDYFAAKAMTGLISNFNGDVSDNYEIISIASYKMADAMLKHRENA